MSELFVWNDNETQVFNSEFGSQSVTDFGTTLSKSPGAGFIMDALGETLSLKIVEKPDQDEYDFWERQRMTWGVNSDDDITTKALYLFNNGEFFVGRDPQEKVDWGFWYIGINRWDIADNDYQFYGSAPVDFIVQNEARVSSVVGGFFSGKQTSLLLRDKGFFITENIGTGVSGIIDVMDNACLTINTGEFFSLGTTITNSSDCLTHDSSLCIRNTDREMGAQPWDSYFYDTTYVGTGDSVTDLIGGILVVGGKTVFSVKDRSKLNIDFTGIQAMKWQDGSCFDILQGTPCVTFKNSSDVIINAEYDLPQGIFHFTTGITETNNGKFIFVGGNAFVEAKLKQSGFIQVDGVSINEYNWKQYLNISHDEQYTITVELLNI